MVKVVAAEKVLAKKSGRPSKLSFEDQVLMTLEYWREDRTYFHMGVNWGLDETNVLRIVRKIENILIKSGRFNLGRKKKIYDREDTLAGITIENGCIFILETVVEYQMIGDFSSIELNLL